MTGAGGAAVPLTARKAPSGLRAAGPMLFAGSEIVQRLTERWVLFPGGRAVGTSRERATRRAGACQTAGGSGMAGGPLLAAEGGSSLHLAAPGCRGVLRNRGRAA